MCLKTFFYTRYIVNIKMFDLKIVKKKSRGRKSDIMITFTNIYIKTNKFVLKIVNKS